MGERPEFYTGVMARAQELELRVQLEGSAPVPEEAPRGPRPWRRLAWRLGDLMLALGHRLTADRCCAQRKSASASGQA